MTTHNHRATPGAAPLTVFRHPLADREIKLNQQLVAYALKRARRSSIGFVVGAEGLRVNAPNGLGIQHIESALHEKAPWILRKLHEQGERAVRMLACKLDWRDGAVVPYLGGSVVITLTSRAGLRPRSAALLNDSRSAALPTAAPSAADAVPAPQTLEVGLPLTASPEQVRVVVQTWLQRQARRVFNERCEHFAARLDVRMTKLSLSSAQTRWGSASASGAIRLNWRLIHFPLASVDYVVAHELAHLREMNHSPRFWAVVRSVLPEFELARRSLKDALVPLLD